MHDTGAALETALYLPVKRFLEKLGFTVKGEVGGCDLVALSGDDPPIVVIGELKLSFNLELIQQPRRAPRLGDPTRPPILTAYRQQALACASALLVGPRRVKDLRAEIPDAGKILLHNVYGWFDRAERGVYVLTDAGHAALKRWP